MVEGPGITRKEARRVWARVAIQSFGGPAGQIAVMHRILVDELRWIGEHRFLHALNYCMLLPGPEAQQLATYLGWLMHGYRGGLVAGGLFVLPGFVTILALSILYAEFRDLQAIDAAFFGLKAAVLAVVAHAVIRIGRRVLANGWMWAIAAAAFVGIYFLEIPFPLIVFGAGLAGLAGGRLKPSAFLVIKDVEADESAEPALLDRWLDTARPAHVRPSRARAARVVAVCAALWFAPIAALGLTRGAGDLYFLIATFFSKAAVVTFGGAYAVLAYIAQQAVEHHGWLGAEAMLDGLGLAETTPGPLIMVVEFVGFLAAHGRPGSLPPWLAGTLGAVLTTWVTFVPCFLWIFLGAPYVEALRRRPALAAGLSAITAAVVGVILNLALWFALHVLFGTLHTERAFGVRLLIPEWTTLDPLALAVTAASFVLLFRLRVGMLPTLGLSVAAGLGLRWVFGV
ncbi:MAG: chromate efflux transporter [Deltaproteobacteria bacterium]|nr:chromate efflux transporter [Deltaproteobacteria bacterium]